MKPLKYIYSERRFSPYPSYQIVYEWEDILAETLGLKIWAQGEIHNICHRRFEKNGLVGLYHRLAASSPLGLRFVMTATAEERCHNNRNSIPVIIDFWLKEEELPGFYQAYRHVPLMLITSREVYDFLMGHHCPIPLEHWPLSYPDTFLEGPVVARPKKYDFCIFGRPNPFFLRLLEEYAHRHPGFEYILNQGPIDHRSYVTNTGRFIGKDTGRASYLEMIASTRISCYTTPGMDESKQETSRFNQVTPRVFEMLSHACHVIGHYTDNPDTRWFNLSSIVLNVNHYEQFEEWMDYCLSHAFDVRAAEEFLNSHKTSLRARQLVSILGRHGIVVGDK